VLQHETTVNCIVLTADGLQAITGDEGGVVRVWDTGTGELCEPILRRHNAEITAVALEYSKAASGDSDRRGRGGRIGRKCRSLQGKVKQQRAGSRSPRVGLCLATRDASATCLLWNWPCEDSVKSSSETPFEQALEQVFDDVLDLTETSSWREQRYWWKDKPDTFTMRGSTEANSPGCAVGYERATNRELEVSPFAPRPDGCDCVARVELESVIQYPTVHAFERRDGVLRTIACCGLRDGMLAVFELVRLPGQGSARPL
jgi:WD40 repeat protein